MKQVGMKQAGMKRLDWNALDETARREALARPAQSRADTLRHGVEQIIAGVRERGDAALRELSAKYDRYTLDAIAVDEAEFVAAEAALDPALKAAIREAAARIELFHRATAPQPSTALMLGVPAQIAGCREVALCSPARADGRCDEAVLYAARLAGVHQVFKLGGAQAI